MDRPTGLAQVHVHVKNQQRIVDMGFSKEAAERALAAAGGNLHQAAESLFAPPPAPPPAGQAATDDRPVERKISRIVELGFSQLAAMVRDRLEPLLGSAMMDVLADTSKCRDGARRQHCQ